MKYKSTYLFIILTIFCDLIHSQTASFVGNLISDDIANNGFEYNNNYFFIVSSGTYSDAIDYRLLGLKDYQYYMLKLDQSLNKIDSIHIDSIDGYYSGYYFSKCSSDTLILSGIAVKPNLSDQQIIISKYLMPSMEKLGRQLYGDPEVLETVNDILITNNNNYLIAANNITDSKRNLIIMEISNNGDLLTYKNDTTLDINWATIYQKPSTSEYIFNSSSQTIIFDSSLNFKSRFWNQNVNTFQYRHKKASYNDSSYIMGGNKFTQPPLNISWDNGYYLVNDKYELIDSGFIYLPDTNDNIGGLGFIEPSNIIYGGTHNRNWSQQTPEAFEAEPRWLVLKSEDLITKNENWFFIYGGDANYFMNDILITTENTILIYGTRYDWQNTDKWQRDIIILEIDANGQLVSTNEKRPLPYATVYPNPSSNALSIKNNFTKGKIIISDISGRKVKENPLTENELKTLDISFLKSGIYIISFYESNKFLFSKKWIKK